MLIIQINILIILLSLKYRSFKITLTELGAVWKPHGQIVNFFNNKPLKWPAGERPLW